MSPVRGLGVDLVSLERMRRFLRQHGSRAKSLFSPRERGMLRGKKRELGFARLFAAKEAYFKALGANAMGLEGFRAIEVTRLGKGRFRCRSRFAAARGTRAEGVFFEDEGYAGAQVILWAGR